MSDLDAERVARRVRHLGPDAHTAASQLTLSALELQAGTADVLPAGVRAVLKDQLLPQYVNASTWLVRTDEALSMRFTATRALLMAEEDPTLLTSAQNRSGGFVFESARGLLGDVTYGMGAYLTPLLLAQSPWTTGIAVPRSGGVIIFLFGELAMGHGRVSADLLQLFHPHGDRGPEAPATLAPGQLEAATTWWIRQLDILFSEVTDPCNYRRSDGFFDLRAQFETMLGLEQAFRNLQSILAGYRDGHAGRLACLDTLDTLEGLRLGLDFRAMCQLQRAERALAEVRSSLPEAIRPVLIPKAELAVDALRKLQSGFFASPRRTPTGVMLPNRHGVAVETGLDDATASWLRLLRNAGHSFRTRDGASGARDEALLVAHDGIVPAALNGLAYLYLLRLVASPSLLRDARTDPKLRAAERKSIGN